MEKKVLVVVNISKDESLALAEEISAFFKERSIQVDFFDFDGFANEVSFEGYSFVITLGGDGTVLFAARNAVAQEIPVFPVNLGVFGFIASVQPENWQKELENLLEGKIPCEERSMLDVQVFRGSEIVYKSLALNDAVVFGKAGVSTVSLEVNYNALPLCKLKSDGVIVATATGSTAYSAAAGGPILSSSLDAFVFTPINSFSLSSRPIVLSMDGTLEIIVEKSRTKEHSICVDGQEPFALKVDDRVVIARFEKNVRLFCSTQAKFYDALRSKLNWSGGPYA